MKRNPAKREDQSPAGYHPNQVPAVLYPYALLLKEAERFARLRFYVLKNFKLLEMEHFVFDEIADYKTNKTQQECTQNSPPETMNCKPCNGRRRKIKHKTIDNKRKQSQL